MSAAAFLLMALGAHAQPLEEALAHVRAERADLAIRLDRWETALPLASIDGLLADPLSLPQTLDAWAERLAAVSSTRTASSFAAELLSQPLPFHPAKPTPPIQLPASDLPPPLWEPIRYLAQIVWAAHGKVRHASVSMTEEERERALRAVRGIIFDDEDAPPAKTAFDAAARFKLGPMLEAADLLEAAASVAARLQALSTVMAPQARVRFSMPFGDVVVAGCGDHAYAQEDLRGVALLVDLGGRSHYAAAPAAAGPGEVRLVLDLSEGVEAAGAAASGVFGAGAFLLPNTAGVKTIKGGDISLGAGLFGAGIFQAAGKIVLESGRFSQGAAAFGIGICSIEGNEARLTIRQSGQGFGFTQGAGLLRVKGDAAVLDGGLNEPDARDPKGALSLSQGVGYGPRAWAAGGAGLALIQGDRNELKASYMAQGMGYWRAFGGLFILGNENRVQGRRYVQGAGVHTAPGGFLLRGNRNKTASWGVGPAIGWDWGVGVFDARGNENSFSSEWASGRGDVNGHGLALVRGKDNRVALGGLGSGAFKRGAGSYGLAAVEAEDALPLGWDSWGVALARPAVLAPEIPAWPDIPRDKQLLRERERLIARLNASAHLPARERAAHILWAIASADLDSAGTLAAAKELLRWDKDRAASLPTLLAPEDFDGWVWLRVLIPARGRELKDSLKKEFAAAKGLRRALVLGQLGRLPLKDAIEEALDGLKDSDWRVRQTAAGILGRYLDKGKGQEPGRRRLLEACARVCESPAGFQPDSDEEKRWITEIGEQYLPDLYSVLNLIDLSAEERAALLAVQDPFAPAQTPLLRELARLLRKDGACPQLLREELSAASQAEGKILKALRAKLADKEREVVHAALLALGGAGRGEDAARLLPFLEAEAAQLREGAAAALARLGPAGLPALQAALRSPSARMRAHAAAALARAGEPQVLAALGPAFSDTDPLVRRTALAGLLAAQNPLVGERKRFLGEVARLANDPDPSVRAQAARLLPQL